MDTTVKETLDGVRDSITVRKVFGEPVDKDGVTVIPAASVAGGGGGGGGEEPGDAGSQRGFGTGFGIAARPAGAYVIRGDTVTWQPAIDVNRLAAGVLVFLTLRLVLGRRRR
ncbi:MAG: sporulation protein [Actinomycetota bacterium]|nr:sporulation protein [Actinomycetota bacterium]